MRQLKKPYLPGMTLTTTNEHICERCYGAGVLWRFGVAASRHSRWLEERTCVLCEGTGYTGEIIGPIPVPFRLTDDETRIRQVGPRLGLTPRQLEVLALCAAGFSNQEIRAVLHIHSSTVRKHLAMINRALGTHNRVQAALCYYRAILEIDEETTVSWW